MHFILSKRSVSCITIELQILKQRVISAVSARAIPLPSLCAMSLSAAEKIAKERFVTGFSESPGLQAH
jgi:hypothetical protein